MFNSCQGFRSTGTTIKILVSNCINYSQFIAGWPKKKNTIWLLEFREMTGAKVKGV
jgi:hypothetical protein